LKNLGIKQKLEIVDVRFSASKSAKLDEQIRPKVQKINTFAIIYYFNIEKTYQTYSVNIHSFE